MFQATSSVRPSTPVLCQKSKVRAQDYLLILSVPFAVYCICSSSLISQCQLQKCAFLQTDTIKTLDRYRNVSQKLKASQQCCLRPELTAFFSRLTIQLAPAYKPILSARFAVITISPRSRRRPNNSVSGLNYKSTCKGSGSRL